MPPSSARMRSSVGGWLLKSAMSPPPVNGFMMNMCAVAGLASSGTRLRDRFDLAQRVGEPVRIAGDLRAARVGGELARPRDRRLDQHRGERRQDDHRDQRDRIVAAIAIVVAPAVAAEHRRVLRHLRGHHDRGRHRRGDRADEDVAVLHVRQLVRDDAFELAVAQHLQDAFGGGHRGVRRVPPRRERVRRRIRNDVDLRHRQLRLPRQPLDHARADDGPGRPPAPDTSSGRSCPRTSTSRSS